MSPMMAGVELSGRAESGCGVVIYWFYCAARDHAVRLQEAAKQMEADQRICRIEIASCEENGYVTCVLVVCSMPMIPTTKGKLATFRREPHKLSSDLGPFLRHCQAAFVDQVMLTTSMGSVSLTLLYRPASEAEPSA